MRVFCSLLTILCINLPLFGGFTVDHTTLLDANGEAFVFRGVNVPHAWFQRDTKRILKNVSKTGANSVRLVFSNGGQWAKTTAKEVKKVLKWCRDYELIAIIEVHDATGYGESEGAVTFDTAVDYWLEMQDVLEGTEDYVVLNIANEPLGNGHPENLWVELNLEAIRRLRESGYTHTLMIDAPNWGQDWRETGKKRAKEVVTSDPLRNTIYSVHMYEVYGSEERVRTYIEAFVENQVCLVIGEFSTVHYGKPVNAEAIMKWSQHYGIGYLGWSWFGNDVKLVELDLVENPKGRELTPWGELLINGPDGIQATSRKASVFKD